MLGVGLGLLAFGLSLGPFLRLVLEPGELALPGPETRAAWSGFIVPLVAFAALVLSVVGYRRSARRGLSVLAAWLGIGALVLQMELSLVCLALLGLLVRGLVREQLGWE